jgi:hypothetical protein
MEGFLGLEAEDPAFCGGRAGFQAGAGGVKCRHSADLMEQLAGAQQIQLKRPAH